jgi:hypothetical protein
MWSRFKKCKNWLCCEVSGGVSEGEDNSKSSINIIYYYYFTKFDL